MSYNYHSSFSSLASTLLFLLILIPSLNLLINGLNSLSTNFILCLFFKAPLSILSSFLKGLCPPAEAFLTTFKGLAEAFRSIFMSLFGMVFEILGSFLMALLGIVKSVVFGSVGASGSGLGDLLDKTKVSWDGSFFEQVREIVGSVLENVVESALSTTGSIIGSLFDMATSGISTLLSEPSSAIGQMVETLKSSLESGSSTGGLRGTIESFIQNLVNLIFGVGISSSISGLFEILKTIFGVVRECGYSLGGLIEKTRAALDVLRMQELRGIIEAICKLGVNMVIQYFVD